jgi:nucleoside-diphosphate-sugar epimerase
MLDVRTSPRSKSQLLLTLNIRGCALSQFMDQAPSGRDITVYGTRDQARFCYVTDTVAAVLLAATPTEMKGEVLNIANPHEVSI